MITAILGFNRDRGLYTGNASGRVMSKGLLVSNPEKKSGTDHAFRVAVRA